MNLSERRATLMVERWNELREADYTNDYEKAVFFRDQRGQRAYQRGTAGDLAFKHDVNTNLTGISGSKALTYIKMLRAYRSRQTWVRLGGFKALYYLAGLNATAGQRQGLMSAVVAQCDSSGAPVTLAIVRSIAKDRGLDSSRGRPSNTVMERHRDTLAQFIFDAYDDLPDDIIAALPHRLAVEFAS